MLTASPTEIQQIKDALTRDPNNLGVGVIHLPTGAVSMCPFNDLPHGGGHAELVQILGLKQTDCRGFIVGLLGTHYTIVNASHLNGPQGQPGSVRMSPALFAQLEQALRQAGL